MGDFQNIFKRLRNSCGLTQVEMAEKIGISRSTIGMYETGAREPDFETLEKIADFFNVDIDYLLGRTDKTTILPETMGQYYLNDEAHKIAQQILEDPSLRFFFQEPSKKLIENYGQLSDLNKKKVINYSDNLLKIQLMEEEQLHLIPNAAHDRTDISQSEKTPEARKIEEDIMDDPNF